MFQLVFEHHHKFLLTTQEHTLHLNPYSINLLQIYVHNGLNANFTYNKMYSIKHI